MMFAGWVNEHQRSVIAYLQEENRVLRELHGKKRLRFNNDHSLAQLLELDLPIPDHTTLSRRLKKLGDVRFRRLATDRPLHLLIDSTGLRIHVGPLRRPPKRRAWRKLHLAVDASTGEIVASELTDRRTHDCTRVGPLLEQIDNPLASLSADGAYDAAGVYEAGQSKCEDEPLGCSSHLDEGPNWLQGRRPHWRRETGTSTPSTSSVVASGTSGPGTASAAWSRILSTGTRRSSVDE